VSGVAADFFVFWPLLKKFKKRTRPKLISRFWTF
jgi:hypothetical protein